jgi:23S rRNA (pseudouridine1915-N3)-methyltransferase
VLLDPRGEAIDSNGLVKRLRGWNDGGRDVAFVIGGPDGLAPTLSESATLHLAFGALTWPHQLVRVMLLEQIYRATTILSGHPYHRE